MLKALAPLAALCLVAACASFVEAWQSAAGPRHLVPFRAAYTPAPAKSPPTNAMALPPLVVPPVLVAIPAVGLSVGVVPVGLNPQGQLEIPSPSVAGWYRLGPAPGAVGPAVIVGHVDTVAGPAAFYRLTGVRTGEEVDVVRADGGRSLFVISGLTQVKKTVFLSQAVFGPTPTPTLRLITRTGPFNPYTGHYIDSLIIWAVPAP